VTRVDASISRPQPSPVFQRVWKAGALLLVAAWLGAGCDERPWVTGKADPKEEPNFKQADGYQRIAQYPKAVEYYQRALDVNPRNAEAHLGLGYIYSDPTKLPEYGYAYYHLRRYVELSGKTNDAIIVPLIQAASLKLAERHANAIGKIQTQGEIEQIKRENAELRKTVNLLGAQLSAANARLGLQVPVPQTTPSQQQQQAQVPAQQTTSRQSPPPATQTETPGVARQVLRQSAPVQQQQPARPTVRTYRIQANDTLAKVAKQYGVSLSQLQAANPGVDPRKLKQGMEIRLP
jgi:LysM repeat protein